MLTAYRRHLKNCRRRDEGRSYRNCRCPIWVDGILGGAEIRESLKVRDWQQAQEMIREWEIELPATRDGMLRCEFLTLCSNVFIIACHRSSASDRRMPRC